jgi:ParB family chromosome partitioning protein
MSQTTEMPTAAGLKADSLKTAEPPKQAAAPPAGAKEVTLDLPLDAIDLAGFFKVRENFDDIGDMVDQLKGGTGQLTPVLVRPAAAPGKYQLIAGYRRYHAAKKAGLKTIKATVRSLDDHAAHLVALSENLVRRDLSPIEEADALAQAIGHGKWQQKELAKALGKSEGYISNRLRLRQLPEPVQELISEGKITAGHVEHALGKIQDKTAQAELARAIVKGDMSVREAEREARELEHQLKERAKFQDAVKASKFPVCPKCKLPPHESHYSYKGAVIDKKGHAWRLSDGKDPAAVAQEEYERTYGGHGSGMASKKKAPPHNYEPLEYRIPASQDELARGAIKWLLENFGGRLEVSDGGWHGISFDTNRKTPFPAPRFHGTEAQFKKDGCVRGELAQSFQNDQQRTAARLAMEKFLRTYVPQATKRIPDEGLYGIGELSKKCPDCGNRVSGPLRKVVKCPGCELEIELLRKKQPGAVEKKAKTVKKAGGKRGAKKAGRKPGRPKGSKNKKKGRA